MDQAGHGGLTKFFTGISQKAAINFELLHQECHYQTTARFDSQDL